MSSSNLPRAQGEYDCSPMHGESEPNVIREIMSGYQHVINAFAISESKEDVDEDEASEEEGSEEEESEEEESEEEGSEEEESEEGQSEDKESGGNKSNREDGVGINGGKGQGESETSDIPSPSVPPASEEDESKDAEKSSFVNDAITSRTAEDIGTSQIRASSSSSSLVPDINEKISSLEQESVASAPHGGVVTDDDADDELEDIMRSSVADDEESMSSSRIQSALKKPDQAVLPSTPTPKTDRAVGFDTSHAKSSSRLAGIIGSAPTVQSRGTGALPVPTRSPNKLPPPMAVKLIRPSAATPVVRSSVPLFPSIAKDKGPRARHANINVDKTFINNTSYVMRPGVGQVFDRHSTHLKNEHLARQKKEQKRAQQVIDAAKKDIAYRNESQRAFQAWLDEKEREKQLKLQHQKRILFVSSIPAWEWEPERTLAKKENKWCGNFGTPAHLLQTNTKTKIKPEKSEEVEGNGFGLSPNQGIKLTILSD